MKKMTVIVFLLSLSTMWTSRAEGLHFDNDFLANISRGNFFHPSSNIGVIRDCSYYRNHMSCQQDPACEWDYYGQFCKDSDWDTQTQCHFYNNRHSCESDENCWWDDYNRECVEGDVMEPAECRDQLCEDDCLDTPGCAWDSINKYCLEMPY